MCSRGCTMTTTMNNNQGAHHECKNGGPNFLNSISFMEITRLGESHHHGLRQRENLTILVFKIWREMAIPGNIYQHLSEKDTLGTVGVGEDGPLQPSVACEP